MLLIIDMQNDFVDQEKGKMPVKNADRLIEGLVRKIDEYEKKGDLIFYTKNIHKDMKDDKRTQEEKEWGQELYGILKERLKNHHSLEKYNYGIAPDKSYHVFKDLDKKYLREIEFVGVETHICLLSNAIILQNLSIDSRIIINENYCSSNNLALHHKALDIMEGLQMEVVRK